MKKKKKKVVAANKQWDKLNLGSPGLGEVTSRWFLCPRGRAVPASTLWKKPPDPQFPYWFGA